MTGPKDVYRRECDALGVMANSGLLHMLPETAAQMEGVSVMHFGHNYLGDRGILPLLHVVAQAKSLHTLNLRDNGIGNNGVRALCRALRRHPSLRVLELSGNPFTYLAARQLVHLCEDSDTITFIGMKNTLMTERLTASIAHRLQEALKRRESRRFAPTARMSCDNNVAITTPNLSGLATAADSSSVGGGTETTIAISHIPPTLAEDATVLRKLSGGALVSPTLLFPRRNSRNSFITSEEKGENLCRQSVAGGLSSNHSSQRPPLASTPPLHPKSTPEWIDMEENNDGADDVEAEEEVNALDEVELTDGEEHQVQQDTESCTESLFRAAKEVQPHSCDPAHESLSSSHSSSSSKHQRCTDDVPDDDASTPSAVKERTEGWFSMVEAVELQQNKPAKKDFLDFLFGDEN